MQSSVGNRVAAEHVTDAGGPNPLYHLVGYRFLVAIPGTSLVNAMAAILTIGTNCDMTVVKRFCIIENNSNTGRWGLLNWSSSSIL